jgi:RNA recognition motif-containing protein
VSVKIILDHDTGRSRGFAFVEMGSSGDAKKAIEGLNGKEVLSREIVVTEARPQVKREGGNGGGFRSKEPGMRRERERKF